MIKKGAAREIEGSKTKDKTCGIIMPIASHPDYPPEHWNDVLQILVDAVTETEFEPNLVSEDVAIGLIHDRIVTNIYNNEIIICDVSSKNPNVMFELGLRLAFDKPTIIIKDDKTGYSFDTGVIEHLSYPASLRFGQMLKFKDDLVRKINATYKKSVDDPHFSPFLKSFGKTIVPASIQQTEVSEGKYIINQLQNLNNQIQKLRVEQKGGNPYRQRWVYPERREGSDERLPIDLIVPMLEEMRKNISKDMKLNTLDATNRLQQDLANSGFDIPFERLKIIVDAFYDQSGWKEQKNKVD